MFMGRVLRLRIPHDRGLCITFMALLIAASMLLLSVAELFQEEAVVEASVERVVFSEENTTTAFARKLLQAAACSKKDIVVVQGSAGTLPNGIPAFTVQIVNVCVSECSLCNIHLRCGWFSSVNLINPTLFRRINFDDCLVNDGGPLASGKTIYFQYANSFRYPLSVSSVSCC